MTAKGLEVRLAEAFDAAPAEWREFLWGEVRRLLPPDREGIEEALRSGLVSQAIEDGCYTVRLDGQLFIRLSAEETLEAAKVGDGIKLVEAF